jgi:molybdopterin-binding protein
LHPQCTQDLQQLPYTHEERISLYFGNTGLIEPDPRPELRLSEPPRSPQRAQMQGELRRLLNSILHFGNICLLRLISIHAFKCIKSINASKGMFAHASRATLDRWHWRVAWKLSPSEGIQSIAYRNDATRRNAMKLSARNVLPATVKAVKPGAVDTEVVVELAPGLEMVSIITKQSAEKLGLKPGAKAYAIVKASSVMIGVD